MAKGRRWGWGPLSVHRWTRGVAPASEWSAGPHGVLRSREGSGVCVLEQGCHAHFLCVLDVMCGCHTHIHTHRHMHTQPCTRHRAHYTAHTCAPHTHTQHSTHVRAHTHTHTPTCTQSLNKNLKALGKCSISVVASGCVRCCSSVSDFPELGTHTRVPLERSCRLRRGLLSWGRRGCCGGLVSTPAWRPLAANLG